jgi:hypothetical protein
VYVVAIKALAATADEVLESVDPLQELRVRRAGIVLAWHLRGPDLAEIGALARRDATANASLAPPALGGVAFQAADFSCAARLA